MGSTEGDFAALEKHKYQRERLITRPKANARMKCPGHNPSVGMSDDHPNQLYSNTGVLTDYSQSER